MVNDTEGTARTTVDVPTPAFVSSTARKASRRRLALSQTIVAIAVPVALLAWWWWESRTGPSLLVPAPGEVALRTVDLLVGPESIHTWTSMLRIVLSVLLALVIGSSLVFIARLVPVTETLIARELLPVLNAVPAVGWAILGVIWLGVGNVAVVFVVTLILLPFCMVNMWEGMRNLDPGLLEMGRSFSRTTAKVLFLIQVPLLMPYLFAALRLSFSVGWKVALIAEFFGAQIGLGLVMNRARQSFDTATVFAAILAVVIIVMVVERLIFEPMSQFFARRTGTMVTEP